ncbi:TonB-dependent receptor [Hyphococcus flavus]|uniref:TonB-dependent receptor n=1 Tax=Hyphococcus flavus TaxID=1866326 RepID=A0AAF0CFZ6_9PROT|nr:TonB-dependent receptor [Hyphococcus flavus]WDI30132.1 TonB-dependent receptor [Hyphococcus flavus]
MLPKIQKKQLLACVSIFAVPGVSAHAADEIVVTAQKREQSLQDVPISVTAVTEDDLKARGVITLEDLQFMVPNVSVTNEFQTVTPKFSIRGVSSNTRNIGFESGLSVYIDGVYTGRPIGQSFDLTDVGQIEVLRGPQGTLFGKNNTAGAINVITKKPGEEVAYNLVGEAGNFGLYRFSGDVSGPLSDTLGAKLALYTTQRNGTVENVFDGTDLNDIDSLGGRAGLYWTPSDDFEASLVVDAFRDRRARAFPEPLDGDPLATTGPRTVNIDLNGREDRDSFGAALNLEKNFDSGLSLTSISGYRKTIIDNQFIDNDDTPAPAIAVNGWFEEAEHFSQEIRLASDAGSSFDWILGGYYFYQKVNSERPIVVFGFDGNSIGEVVTNSYAGFGQVNIRPVDRLTVTGGARVTYEKKELNNFTQDIMILFPSFGPLQDEIDETNFSPMAALTYELSGSLNVYGTYSKGFKSGGFNVDYISDASDLSFLSESVGNAEVGLKGNFLEGDLTFAASAFQMKYDDLQVLTLDDISGGLTVQNAVKATIKGLEFEFSARPVQGFEIVGGLGVLDATYDDFRNADAMGSDFTGNELPDAPGLTANAAAQYTHELGGSGSLFGLVEWSYRDERYSSASNTIVTQAEDISLVNMRAGYRSPDERWELSAWVKNLADTDRIVFGFANPFSGAIAGTYNDPRTWGVTLRVSG